MSDNQFPVEDIRNKIKNILSEPEIRFCGLIDSSGELVAGDFGSEIIPLENDKKRKQMFQELAHRVANRKGFDANLGRVKYSASRRENVVMMSFPLGKSIRPINDGFLQMSQRVSERSLSRFEREARAVVFLVGLIIFFFVCC